MEADVDHQFLDSHCQLVVTVVDDEECVQGPSDHANLRTTPHSRTEVKQMAGCVGASNGAQGHILITC